MDPRNDEERLTAIESRLDEEPSERSWREICAHLAAMRDDTAADRCLIATI